nr:uncharacterized protein LOC117275154 [Nicotiana tomentosiformis]
MRGLLNIHGFENQGKLRNYIIDLAYATLDPDSDLYERFTLIAQTENAQMVVVEQVNINNLIANDEDEEEEDWNNIDAVAGSNDGITNLDDFEGMDEDEFGTNFEENAKLAVDIQVNIDNLVGNAENEEEQQFYCGLISLSEVIWTEYAQVEVKKEEK